MTSDCHEHFQQKIDELLVTGEAVEQNEPIRQHLASCALCREYLSLSRRVVAGLADLSFDVDPTGPARISASLRKCVQQMDRSPFVGRRPFWIFALALALTAIGSWIDLRLSDWIAPLFDFQKTQARGEIIRFWIIPAFLLVALFPMLPLLFTPKQQSERSLL